MLIADLKSIKIATIEGQLSYLRDGMADLVDRSYLDNPYPQDTDLHVAWLRGYELEAGTFGRGEPAEA